MKITEEEKRTLQLFKLLGNSTRFMIINILESGTRNVTELIKLTNKRQTVVSKHLRLLRDLDIVSFKTIENKVYYSLKKKEVIELIKKGLEIMKRDIKKE
ncbi:winged helix-turn-helix transcriptional regulator [bacterium]|nr:winged helix-turn-helix transcriptional regulator [bacterium]